MATSILNLIVNDFALQDGTWGEVTKNMFLFILKLLVIAAINYPTFMCIYSPYKLLASFLGGIFMLCKMAFFFLEITHISCGKNVNKGKNIAIELVRFLPTIVCFIALFVIFAFTFIKYLRKRQFGKIEKNLQVASDHHVKYLKALIKSRTRFSIATPLKVSWYKKPYQKIKDIYQGTLQYSIIFLSSIAIILILFYYIFVGMVYGASNIYDLPEMIYNMLNQRGMTSDISPFYKAFANGLVNSYIISMVTTIIFYTWLLIDLLQTHENNLHRLFAGQFKEKVYTNLSARSLTFRSILFPGYFIAYMFWGLIVFFVAALLVVFIVYGFILLLIYSPASVDIIIQILKKMYLIFTLPLLAYVLQFFLVKFVFMQNYDKNAKNEVNEKKMLLKNVKMYHLTIYIFFFYNLIVGITSCILRSIKALVISLLVLGRVDQTPFAFLKRFDTGHCAYLGFLHLQRIYKNPVMRCFLQMLQESTTSHVSMMPIGGMNTTPTTDFRRLEENPSSSPSPSRVFQASDIRYEDKVIRNRWLIAYTLINNPNLVKERGRTITARSSQLLIESNHNGGDYQMDSNRNDLLLSL